MNKKLQVFVSSTYTDLIEERQAAVEAILDAGHIPAGMELFKAGKSQMQTIRKWIDESDVYMLILGGRYGSIEEESGLSYTELEYKYALSKKMPFFAVVLSEQFIKNKNYISEESYSDKYDGFKSLVMTNMIKVVNDCKDIKLAISTTLNEFIKEYNLRGWIPNNKKYFNSSEDVDTYIYNRIKNAKACVYDLTWKDFYHNPSGRANYNSYINSQNAFLDIIMEKVKQGLFYKEIFTFPHERKERIEKMKTLVNYENYWCGFFESNENVRNFPKLHIIIIDESEAIFVNYDYKENYCSIIDKNIVNILEIYFNECWSLCKKIKDYEGIHQNIYEDAIADYNKV